MVAIHENHAGKACYKCGRPAIPQRYHSDPLCIKHARFNQMRVAARDAGKAVPSLTLLESFIGTCRMTCTECGIRMRWTSGQRDGGVNRKTVISLQHDAYGRMRFVCASCNSKLAWVEKPYAKRLRKFLLPRRAGTVGGGIRTRLVVDGMAECCTCKQMKPIAEFTKKKNICWGFSYECKPCRNTHPRRSRSKYATEPTFYTPRRLHSLPV
jgi:hypothetical protein